MAVTRDLFDTEQLSPGDEVVFIGRYLNHEGREENRPVVRSGIIAQVGGDPVRQERLSGIRYQESILVEERSLGGASGSPVFCYRDARLRGTDGGNEVLVAPMAGMPIRLLGINWGHHHISEQVRLDGTEEATGQYVPSNSGVAMVVPAWKLTEFLDTLSDSRRAAEEHWLKNNT